MKTVAVTQFKAQCLSLLEDVARTGEQVIVTKRGKPLARVVPSGASGDGYPQNTLKGSVTILGDVVAPVVPADAWNAVRGVLVEDPPRKAKKTRVQKKRAR